MMLLKKTIEPRENNEVSEKAMKLPTIFLFPRYNRSVIFKFTTKSIIKEQICITKILKAKHDKKERILHLDGFIGICFKNRIVFNFGKNFHNRLSFKISYIFIGEIIKVFKEFRTNIHFLIYNSFS